MARRKKTKGVSVDLSKVGKSFEADTEVLVKCVECELEEGDSALYFAMKLEGTGDYEGAVMYHNASTAEKALWRLRPLVEAFGIDIPDGPMDLEPEDFVGKFAMCSTYKDRYNGKVTIKPEDFWPAEDVDESEGGDSSGEVEFDLDELDDDDILALGKKLGIKGKKASTVKGKLEDADEDELLEAAEELGLLGEDGGGDEGDEGIDLDELDDDDIKALAKAAGIKGKVVKKLKAALEELDEDELAEAAEEAGIGGEGGDEGEGAEVTAEDIQGMNEDQLEAFVEEHELDVDLDDFKTLRKKKAAVVDAAEEAEVLAD